jgi:hypothetical protein
MHSLVAHSELLSLSVLPEWSLLASILIDTMGWGLEPTVQGMVTVPVTVSISP